MNDRVVAAWLARQSEQPLNACIATKKTSPQTIDIYLISQIGKWNEFCVTIPPDATTIRIAMEVANLHRLFAQKVLPERTRN